MGTDCDGGPLLTVIVPTYNRAELVTRSVTSVLDQVFVDLEMIVVDDGSSDDSVERLSGIEDDRVRLERQDHAGANAARNLGASLARGTLLVFLDSDDELLPGCLAAFANACDEDVGLVSVDEWHQSPDGNRVRVGAWDLGFVSEGAAALFQSGTYAVRRTAFLAVGGFDARLASGHHTDLAFRLLPVLDRTRQRIVHVPRALVVHHLSSPHSIRRDHEAVLRGTEGLLDRHHEVLERAPSRLADYYSVAGVAAMRLNETARARRHLRAAVRYQPDSLRRWARLGLAYLPRPLRPWGPTGA